MFRFKKLAALVSLLAAMAAHAGPGINDIAYTSTAMSPTGNWPLGHDWRIRAILTDSSGHAIGVLSATTLTLDTTANASFPTGFAVLLGAAAPADAIFNVYRSTTPFSAGDQVERAEYDGVCMPAGCPAGVVTVPATGALLNSDFKPDNTAMPVTLQEFSVD